MTFDEWYREHYTAHDSGLIATYSAAKAGWEAAIAASASAEPKPACPHCGLTDIEYSRTCHNSACSAYAQEESVYRGWDQAPRPIEAPDNSQAVALSEQERAAFDDWWERRGPEAVHMTWTEDACWFAWQARAALSAPANKESK